MTSIPNAKRRIAKVSGRLAQARRALTPGRRAWRGATWGGLIAVLLLLVTMAYSLLGQAALPHLLTGTALILVFFGLAGGLLTLIGWLFRRVPARYMWVLSSAVLVALSMMLFALSVPLGILAMVLGMLVVGSLLGAGIAELLGGGWRAAARVQRFVIAAALVTGVTGLIVGGIWLLDAGRPLTYPPGIPTLAESTLPPLDMPDPSQPGPYAVRALTYGSGDDVHRPEYGAEVDIVTLSVDGTALVEGWSDLRTRYWGFDAGALPLNGRVWYPDGEGPFPLVMIVHGQHPMEDDSDPGYAYLGELLASRGFIVTSIDENFLNLSPLADVLFMQGLQGENDLRAWLLLEHLRVWRDWNDDPSSDFYQMVNMDQIALIGHSRGGEAVAIATAFNELTYYPDDAAVRFDYGFNIRSVVAFAPVDGTYRPAGHKVHLQDINYLVLHGAHDMDVFTFRGSEQYARVSFSGDRDRFKAALYIYGANHGQFNTRWGRKDSFEPIMRVFDLAQLMPPEAQQQIAKVMIGAFLEDTLRGETGYRPLFQDIRRGRDWLPDTIYLHQYADADTRMIATYEEDIDLTSTTLPGGRITGENLAVWREQPVQSKWETMSSQAVYLGWDATKQASYTVDLPALSLTEDSVLVFAMAAAEANPETIDLTVELVDRGGNSARLPLSHYAPLLPQLEGHLGKAAFMAVTPTSEAVLQSFAFRMADFAAQNADFDPEDLVQVRFVFDRTKSGIIVLDDVGIRPQ